MTQPTPSMLRFFRDRCSLEEQFVQQYAKLFTDQHITETEISDLSHELLKEIGITAVGHRIRILKFSRATANPLLIKNELPSLPTSLSYTNTSNLPTDTITIDLSETKNSSSQTKQSNEQTNNDISSETENNENISSSSASQANTSNQTNIKPIWSPKKSDYSSSDEEDEELPSDLSQIRRQNDFEGVVLMNHLISSRSTSVSSEPFPASVSNPNFAPKLKKYLKRMFMVCQVPPRSHQLKALELLMHSLLKNAEADPPITTPQNYLLQHSIGSGKSLIIAALVYLLSTVRSNGNQLFDIILVLNDRKQLDMQLWLTVSRFLSTHGIFVDSGCRPSTSSELGKILAHESKKQDEGQTEPSIIFSTLQKFVRASTMDTEDPQNLAEFPNRIAIIADEAHRSHGKRSTRLLHDLLTGNTRQKLNITYFSFTSTPTANALAMFGVTKHGNVKEPFHTYSIADAIHDGHICNPLANYTTVSTKAMVRMKPNAADDKLHRANISRTIQHVTRVAASNIELLRSRAEFIVKHFIEEIRKKKKTPSFDPKAMVVASSRLSILRYKEILEEIIATRPEEEQFEVVAAFTPFVHQEKCYYEEDINTQYGVHFLREFQTPGSSVQMIIVHSKFLIGFDEPSLHTMYIDRAIHGSSLVQALGRLCRVAPGKKDTCVVDFVNPRKRVADIFGLFWNKTTMKTFDNFKDDKAKLKRIEDELKGYECLREKQSAANCVSYLKRENQFNPNVIARVVRLIGRYISLCDSMQVESKSLSITQLKSIVPLLDAPNKEITVSLGSKCTDLMEVTVSDISQVSNGKITPAAHRVMKQPKTRNSRTSATSVTELVSVNHVLNAVSQRFNDRNTILTTESLPMPESIEEREVASGITPETLEFATSLLRRSHENQDSPASPEESKKKRKTLTAHTVFDQSPDDPPSSPEVGISITKHLQISREKENQRQPSTSDRKPNAASHTNIPPSLGSETNTSRGIRIVPRIQEISKGFNLLVSAHEEEAQTGLDIVQKHVELCDNKVELQRFDLIPKILNYIKSLYMEEKNEVRMTIALQILARFSDCIRDVDQMMNFGILQQLTRIMRRCSPSLAVAGSKLLSCMVDISIDNVAPAISNTEILRSIREHINNENASLSAVHQYISTLGKLGNNPLCLAEIYKCGLVETFFEITAVETAPTASMAASAIQNFARQNHSIRNFARNNRYLEDKMRVSSEDASPDKRESVQKLIRYIWGSHNRSKAKRPRSSKKHNLQPPRKKHRSDSTPQVQSTHSITYQTESRRLRR